MKSIPMIPTSLTIALSCLLLLFVTKAELTRPMEHSQETALLALCQSQVTQILSLVQAPSGPLDTEEALAYLGELQTIATLQLPAFVHADGSSYQTSSLLHQASLSLLWEDDQGEGLQRHSSGEESPCDATDLLALSQPQTIQVRPLEGDLGWALYHPIDQGLVKVLLPLEEPLALGETSCAFLGRLLLHGFALMLCAILLVQCTLGRLPAYIKTLAQGGELGKKPPNMLETSQVKGALWELFRGLRHYITEIEALQRAYQPYVSPNLLKQFGKQDLGDVAPGDCVAFPATVITIHSTAVEEALKDPAGKTAGPLLQLLNRLIETLNTKRCVMVYLDDMRVQGIFPENLPYALEVAKACAQLTAEEAWGQAGPRTQISVIHCHTKITVLGNEDCMRFYPQFSQEEQIKALIHYGTALGTSVLFRHCDLPKDSFLLQQDWVRLCAQDWDGPEGKLYEDFSGDPPLVLQGKLASKDAYTQGLSYFYQQDYQKARDCLIQALRIHPDDHLAETYFKKCDQRIYGEEGGGF